MDEEPTLEKIEKNAFLEYKNYENKIELCIKE